MRSTDLFSQDEAFRIIYENAAVGIARTGPDGRILQVNPTLISLLGYTAEDLLAKHFLEITHPEDVERSRTLLQQMKKGAELSFLKLEKRYLHKAGHVVFANLSVTPIRDPEGQVRFFVTVIEDITEQKLSQDLLRNQKEVLELMAQNLPLNDTLNRIVKLIEDQAPGCMSTTYLVRDGRLFLGAAPTFPRGFIEAFQGTPIGPESGSCGVAAYTGKRMVSTNIAVDPGWGSYRERIISYGIKSAWSTPVLSKEGKVIGTVSMCWKEPKEPTSRHFELVDVAVRLTAIAIERDDHEKVIRQQQAKLISSSKMAALGEMAGGLAHEINNPLAIVHGRANQLKLALENKVLNDALLAEIAESIRSTALRISKIIKGLRAFARDGEQDPFQYFSLRSIFNDTLAMCQERFRNHAIDLRIPEVSDSLMIDCRPVQISQVLLNLLNNSFDAIQNLQEKWIEIQLREEGNDLILSVTDSGHGIPQEIREKIAEPFFTTKGAGNGTGLGLSISMGIVGSHRGNIHLDTDSPHTRFVITLPKRQTAEKRISNA